MTLDILVVGGGTVGRTLVRRLLDRGDRVTVIERDRSIAELLRDELPDATVRVGDATDPAVLAEAGADDVDVVVAATGDDDTNLLAAQLTRTRFETDRVIARVNQPDNTDAFDDLDIDVVPAAEATAIEIDNYIERPSLTRWMEQLGRGGEALEVPVTNPEFVGRPIGELDAELPEQCLLAIFGGEGTAHLPDEHEIVEAGDHVTVFGERGAVERAAALLNPDEPDESERSAAASADTD